jgi:hypothetical protein
MVPAAAHQFLGVHRDDPETGGEEGHIRRCSRSVDGGKHELRGSGGVDVGAGAQLQQERLPLLRERVAPLQLHQLQELQHQHQPRHVSKGGAGGGSATRKRAS